MPVVPSTRISTVTQQGSNVNASGADFAPGAARLNEQAANLDQASDNLSAISLDMQMRENSDRVLQAEVALKDAERAFSAEMGQRRGKDAIGLTEEAEKWWQDKVTTISSELENDNQRQLFGELAADRRNIGLNNVSAYEAAQRRESFNQTSKAAIETSVAAAAAAPFSPATTQYEKSRVLETIGDLAESNGWTPEIIEAETQGALTALHGEVVSALMAQSPLAAEEYFKANRDEIAGDARAQMDKMITAAVVDHKGQLIADSVFDGEDSYSEAIKEVGKIKDPDLRRAARQHVNQQYGDAVAARQENEVGAADDAWKVIASGGHVNSIPVQVWGSLSGQEQIRIQDYDRARTAAQIKPVTVDDYVKLTEAEQGIENRQIRTLEDLLPYEPYLRRATFDSLRDSLMKADDVNQDDVRKLYESRIGAKRDSGDGWEDAQHEEFNALRGYINQRVKEGARLQDVEALVDRWFMEGYGKSDRFLRNDPNELGESIREGRTDFVIKTPSQDKRLMQDSITVLQTLSNDLAAQEITVDDFYTTVGFDAQRFFIEEGIESNEYTMAAYAYLKSAGKPITAANVHAQRFFIEEGIESNEYTMAAYAYLKSAGKPITAANVRYIEGQIRGN